MSRRKRGTFHNADTALAATLLPQPLTPITSIPFGVGTPAAIASRVNSFCRRLSQSFR